MLCSFLATQSTVLLASTFDAMDEECIFLSKILIDKNTEERIQVSLFPSATYEGCWHVYDLNN